MLTRTFSSLITSRSTTLNSPQLSSRHLQPHPRRAFRLGLSLVLGAVVGLGFALPSYAGKAYPAGVQGAIAEDGSHILTLEGELGIENAAIPESIREELLLDFEENGDPERVYVLNQQIVEAIDRSIESGEVDAVLEPYIGTAKVSASCENETRTYSKNHSFDWNGSNTNSSVGLAGSKFEGSMEVIGDASGSVTMDLRYEVKRGRLFWLGPCVSWWVSPKDVRAYGDATIDGDLDASGDLSNTNDPWTWEWDVVTVDLGTYGFSVFGIPFTVAFDLPITAGLTVEAAVAAELDFDSDAHFSGTFDYTCTKNGCTGSSSFQASGFGNPTLSSSISGRVKVEGFLDVGARADLEVASLGVIKGQVGVRGVAYADFWGYWGNLCGDRDDDGANETVSALTLTLDLQAFLNAEVDLVFLDPREWPDLAHTQRYHLAFVDIIGSSAIEPIFHGPSEVAATVPSEFTVQMAPCWPYDDDVDLTVHWGDGTSDTVSGDPNAEIELSHTYSNAGTYAATLTVDGDSHGRSLGHETERTLDASGLVAQLDCWDVAHPIYQCDGSGIGGTAPYFPEWRVIGDPIYSDQWSEGGFSRQYQCKPTQSYTLQFRIFDSAGNFSIASWNCNNGPV